MKTLKMKKILVALMLVCLSVSSFTLSAQSKGNLLYEGDYTQGTLVSQSFGNTIQPAMRYHNNVKIYEDHLEDLGRWNFEGMSGGNRVYSTQVGWNPPITVKYYVDGNFNITEYRPVPGMYGYETFVSQFSKGNVVFDINSSSQGDYIGGNSEKGSKGTTTQTHGRTAHQVIKSCPLCLGSGKCKSCNGTHRINYQFGSGTLECPNCKPNGACSKCGGSGKITTTEWY